MYRVLLLGHQFFARAQAIVMYITNMLFCVFNNQLCYFLFEYCQQPEKQNSEELMDMSDEVSSLQKEVARLKQVNQDLYTFVTKKIVSKWRVES